MMHEAQHPKDDRSLGDLFKELVGEITTLVRQEAALAKAEMSQKAAEVGKNVGFLAAGGAVAYAGLLTLIAAIVFGLIDAGLAAWASALIVGLVVAAVGGALVWKGLQALKETDLTPRQTIESIQSLKEDRNEPTGVRSRAARPS